VREIPYFDINLGDTLSMETVWSLCRDLINEMVQTHQQKCSRTYGHTTPR